MSAGAEQDACGLARIASDLDGALDGGERLAVGAFAGVIARWRDVERDVGDRE